MDPSPLCCVCFNQVDSLLPESLNSTIQMVFRLLSFLLLCALSSPWFMLAVIPLVFMFYRIQRVR